MTADGLELMAASENQEEISAMAALKATSGLLDKQHEKAGKEAAEDGNDSDRIEDEEVDKCDEAPLLNGTGAAVIKPLEESIEEMERKYAAYIRKDNYGALGRGPICVWEKAKLLIALVTIVPLRVVLLILVLLTYYLICRIFTLFRSPSDEQGQENYGYLRGFRRYVIVNSGRFLARLMLFVLGFYWIKVTNKSDELVQESQTNPEGYSSIEVSSSTEKIPGAIVSNHVSHLDILYHMSASFPSFVAKRSVAKLPLVGLISKCMGCIYVQRESKTSDTKGVSGIVMERMRAAHSEGGQLMLLFPEGTTTNGEYLLPFKTGAFLAQTPVIPVILKYPYDRFSPAWESISGVRHIILLMCQLVNYMEVTRLGVYCPISKEREDPKLYASNVRNLISKEGGLIMSDVGLQEKRIYLTSLRAVQD